MNKELKTTALAFCQECLGWEDAHFVDRVEHSIFTKVNGITAFPFQDLNAVVKSVQGWCESNPHYFVLNYQPAWDGYEARYRVYFDTKTPYVGDHDRMSCQSYSTDPCWALLSGCVAAARELARVPR